MDFRRRDVQRAATSSQLTESLATSSRFRRNSNKNSNKASAAKGGRGQPRGMQGLMARLGVDTTDCDGDELPSAFDSEDEDDGVDMEDLGFGKSAIVSRGGRYGDIRR